MAVTSQQAVGPSAEGRANRQSAWLGPRSSLPATCLKLAVLAIMLVMIVALLRFPLRRINAAQEINYNEGWNAYKQTLARSGMPLYGAPPDALTGATTYPPISFHWIGWLAHGGDVVKTGRWLSLLALAATGMVVGLIVAELGGDAVAGVFSGLLYVLGIVIFLPDRLGMNDPQLLGEALTAAGLYCYVKTLTPSRQQPTQGGPRARDGLRLLCASALLFCLAGFTKQNLLAFPAAAGVDLLLRSRRRFAVWCGAMLICAAALTGLTLAIDGKYFVQHLLFQRTYSFDDALISLTQSYLVTFQGIVLVAIVWILCRFRTNPLLTAAFVCANALAFALSGGDGVDLNIYFNAFAAGVIICGIAVVDFEGGQAVGRSSSGMKAAALMTALLVCVSIGLPDRLDADRAQAELLAHDDAEFQAAVALVRVTPGPAICEDLLLCYSAGKPYLVDLFVSGDQLELGALDNDAIPGMLRSRKFGAIELDVLPEEASASAPLVRKRPRFSEKSMDALLQNYNLALRTAQMLVFVAK